MIILETDRLILRELTFEDDAFVFELLNEPAYLQYIGDKGVRVRSPTPGRISQSARWPATRSTASVSGWSY